MKLLLPIYVAIDVIINAINPIVISDIFKKSNVISHLFSLVFFIVSNIVPFIKSPLFDICGTYYIKKRLFVKLTLLNKHIILKLNYKYCHLYKNDYLYTLM